ncbi:MAG TPA: ABC transporter substrate-binding protein [Polyangiales bacterium]|nr:ABC transporter substrate-binding protein [Polyangiales bacterium]
MSGALCLLGLSACESLLGLDEFTQQPAPAVAGRVCNLHADCADPSAQFRCLQNRCSAPRTEDCSVAAGPELDDRAIWIGALLSSSGTQNAIDRARHASAVLAVESINAAGGVPFDATRTELHPLVLVACDAQHGLLPAATHLTQTLGIRALLGPADTEDANLLAAELTIPSDTLLLNPLASANGFRDLLDDDLAWSMTPSDAQRATLMFQQVKALEDALRAQPGRSELRLGIVFRDDAQGQSARASLNRLTFDEKPLTDPGNLGDHVRIDGYAPGQPDYRALAETYAQFAPDILILLGASEAVTQFLPLLEARSNELRPGAPRPQYLLSDRAKVPELISLADADPALAARIRGVGVTPTAAARDNFTAFAVDLQRRFPDSRADLSGLGSIYDGTHALALALAQRHQPLRSGRELALGLRALTSGQLAFDLRSERLAQLFERVLSADAPLVMGSLGPLQWDQRGAAAGGSLEVWCVGRVEGRSEFFASGIRMTLGELRVTGTLADCERSGQAPGGPTDKPAIQSGEAMRGQPMQPSGGAAGAPATVPEMPVDAGPTAPIDAGVPPSTGAEPPASGIPCGRSSCDSQRGQFCCVSIARGAGEDPQPGDFSCESAAAQCAIALHCTSDTDCTGGEVCCGTGSQAGCMPAERCTAQAGTRLACESASDCAAGTLCCAHLTPGTTTYARVSCDASCPLVESAVPLCRNDADCTAAGALGTCQPSRIVPNLSVCFGF